MSNEKRWQVPGNANPFDSKLEDWKDNKISERSIGVLDFINKHGKISKNQFEHEIVLYLETRFGHEINESNRSHFFRPLEFVGLIRNVNNKLSLSIDGKNFLREVHKQNFDKALDYYILQLLKSNYPNSATKRINLSLFPFKIIFKMLLENPIKKEWFRYKIPYITNVYDINNIENINCPGYVKWQSWVLSYLEKWGIIFENDGYIELSCYKKKFIENILKDIEYEEMFFDTDEKFLCAKINFKKGFKRDKFVTNEVLIANEYKCFFDENHITFPTETKENYVEGHHVIPLSLSDSFEMNLDVKENIIPVCPNCHKAIHYSKNDYKEDLLKNIMHNHENISQFNIKLDDLKEIYLK